MIRRHTDDYNGYLIRRTKLDRGVLDSNVMSALGSLDCTLEIDPDILSSMPKGTSNDVEVVLFKPHDDAYSLSGRYLKIETSKLPAEYEKRGLVPVDPSTLIAMNDADSSFCIDHFHATIWRNAQGEFCSCTFAITQFASRDVTIGRAPTEWHNGFYFAGVRK